VSVGAVVAFATALAESVMTVDEESFGSAESFELAGFPVSGSTNCETVFFLGEDFSESFKSTGCFFSLSLISPTDGFSISYLTVLQLSELLSSETFCKNRLDTDMEGEDVPALSDELVTLLFVVVALTGTAEFLVAFGDVLDVGALVAVTVVVAAVAVAVAVAVVVVAAAIVVVVVVVVVAVAVVDAAVVVVAVTAAAVLDC
jgi:hypothetical protein